MTIHLCFITFNRLEYTKLALASLLAEPTEQFALTVWDNASTDGTVEYLKKEVSDRRIVDIVFSKSNVGQTVAVNEIWSKSKADLLGKLDNDCLVTPGWTRILSRAHNEINKLGVVGCWNFFADDFDYKRAKHKIQTFGKHQIFRHPWICGTGLLIKRETFKKLGLFQNRATTQYWLNMAAAGYINGFYFPLIYQEHMDDPKSAYCKINTEDGLRKAVNVTAGLQFRKFRNVEETLQWRREIIRNLLDDPYDPHYYLGWRRRWRSAKSRLGKLSKSLLLGKNG